MEDVHKLGVSGFEGEALKEQKRKQYEFLTGRPMKRVKMSRKLLANVRAKAERVQLKEETKLKSSGVVVHKSNVSMT
eukprot:CAMPEP_0194370354 /NCGR_PEP_ID=MMETSP0174-20130528/18636_1 /TAXON_ID=216777 /ORGANISM="Proboscia alata, Strain PI-D3" /LENGTH=76 /DNA_ID=CAMNT_0039147751 /DNA_START=177 /DNA_END=403 /DNA_ORIENTATION=+